MIEYYNDLRLRGDAVMEKREALARRVRAIVALVLVALYAAGLVAMLASNVWLGSILWVVSTLGGIGLLYWIHTMNKRKEDAARAQNGGDAPSGER